jgi:AraC family transcriptional regulator
VALDSAYGSHEAFSRAFREQFGVTPETVRARGNLNNIELVEAIKMEEALIALKAPHLERRKAILIAGLSERYNNATSSGIPAQWQRFGPYIGNIPGQVDRRAYGVRCNLDDECSLDYICGVEVSSLSSIPEGLTGLRIPEQNYAVFTHEGHVSGIRSTWHTIFSQWFPSSGYEVVDAPDFELYGEEFDPRTGMGGTEIWIPVRPA